MCASLSLTFQSDFSFAEFTASVVAGLAEVVPSVGLGHLADLQACGSVHKTDFSVSRGGELLPVLHPLDNQRRGPTDVAGKTHLVALDHRHCFKRDVEYRWLLGLCSREDQFGSYIITLDHIVINLSHFIPKNWNRYRVSQHTSYIE